MPIPRPREDLGLREGYHSPQVDVAVRLNTNEAPLPPPDGWLAALSAELGRALAEFHGVRTEQVFCANGSNEVLQSLCLAYGGPGRSVAVFEPTYALHSHIAHLTGTEVFDGQRRPDFCLDLDAVRELLADRSPTLTFLCSPNNPTGLAEDPSTVQAVLSEAGGLLVVDEAYGQFADWSALSLVDDDTPLVVTRTFSKTWSMAAARLGYLVGPEQVVTDLERVVLPYHLDAVKQAAGRLALRFVGEMEQRVGLIVRERQRILAAMGRLPATTWPSQSNFVLFRPDRHKGEDVWHELLERGILIRNTSSWPGLTGCLRVTVGTPDENDAFLGALAEVLS
jgi:histidinol-phosphate aminotransferase